MTTMWQVECSLKGIEVPPDDFDKKRKASHIPANNKYKLWQVDTKNL